MGKELLFTIMEGYTRAPGKQIREMAEGSSSLLVATRTLEDIKMEKRMAKVFILGLMVRFLKASGPTVRRMDKECGEEYMVTTILGPG